MTINKPCFLVAHGKSVEELECRIEEFKDLDVIWCSLNAFYIPEKYILNKINKNFNIVFDTSAAENAKEYEIKLRIPILSDFLDRKEDNIYISNRTEDKNLWGLRNRLYIDGYINFDFNNKYKEKIIYVEDLGIKIRPFKVSLHLFIACLCKMGAKKIVLFGADGGAKYEDNNISYYKWGEVKKDKELVGNFNYNMIENINIIIGDANNINGCWNSLMTTTLGYVPEILNCTPITNYTVFKQISYNQLLEEYL